MIWLYGILRNRSAIGVVLALIVAAVVDAMGEGIGHLHLHVAGKPAIQGRLRGVVARETDGGVVRERAQRAVQAAHARAGGITEEVVYAARIDGRRVRIVLDTREQVDSMRADVARPSGRSPCAISRWTLRLY